jgi:hypothetical protein
MSSPEKIFTSLLSQISLAPFAILPFRAKLALNISLKFMFQIQCTGIKHKDQKHLPIPVKI